MNKIAVVIPFLNEAAILPKLVQRLTDACQTLEDNFGVHINFIFVDDGSSDNSREILKTSLGVLNHSEILVLSRNFGKEAAMMAGLSAADADATIIMDADLQHEPELIEQFLIRWREGYDIVYSYKENRHNESIPKRLFSTLFYFLINKGSRVQIPSDAGDFRLLSRRAVDALLSLQERERFTKGLYAWIGFRQIGIPYTAAERTSGKSSFSFGKLFSLSMDGLTSFTIGPLRAMGLFGFIVAALSFLYLSYIIAEKLLWNNDIPGFASLIVLISFFGGVQMLCFSLIGEYIGKTLIEAKRRPQFIVAEHDTFGPQRKPS